MEKSIQWPMQLGINLREIQFRMEQLINLVEERFRRVRDILLKNIEPQQIRFSREQQKQRCEKQSWILSMVRLNKNVTLPIKNSYLNASYKIMRVIEPEFEHNSTQPNKEQNFLNELVYLYRHFFDRYEENLNFKVKVKSLLRPTNHNIINDMLKYLIDFTRDYYQQTFLWKMRNTREKEEFNQLQKRRTLRMRQQMTSQAELISEKNGVFDGELGSKTYYSKSKLSAIIEGNLNRMRNRYQDSDDISQQTPKKNDISKPYQILDINNMPSFSGLQKDRNNLQQIRTKMNDAYRQSRFRNTQSRQSYQSYLTAFQQFKNINSRHNNQYCSPGQICTEISYPFRVALCVEKNGSSSLVVTLCERTGFRFNATRDGNARHSRYGENFQRANQLKGEYLICSLRVLRVSDNFQPMVPPGNRNTPILHIKNQNLPKINFLNSERVPVSEVENRLKQEMTLSNKPSTSSIKLSQRRPDKRIPANHNTEKALEQSVALAQTNSQMFNQKRFEGKKISSKIFSIRKHFTSQDRNKIRSRQNGSQSEQKILQWLEKIKIVKDLERRKILGI